MARRLTKVVSARRMKPGRSPIAVESACFWRPMAPVVVARWSTRPARSARRVARSPTSCEDSPMKRLSAGVSESSALKSRLEAASDGFR